MSDNAVIPPPNPQIIVRRSEPEDFDALHTIYSHDGTMRGTLQIPYSSRESWRKRMENLSDDHFGLVACVGEDMVGSAGLHLMTKHLGRQHCASVWAGVRDDFLRRGVGTALMNAVVDLADNWLNIMRLELEVYTTNTPAIRLYEKFGFVIEGTMRMWAFRDGVYVDAHSMGRIHARDPDERKSDAV